LVKVMSERALTAEELLKALGDMPCDLSVEEVIPTDGPDPFSVEAIDPPEAAEAKP
jgi:hypothetical protein